MTAPFAVVFCSMWLWAGEGFADDWPAYQHDPAHAGRSSAAFDPTQLRKAWTAPQGYSNPIVVGNSIYAMRHGANNSSPSTITSFNIIDGTQNWSTSFPFSSARGLPAYANGLLVFVGGSTTGPTRLHVLDAATGAQKYTVDESVGLNTLMPTISRNANNQLVAYVANADRISAFDIGENSGSVIWSRLGSFGGSSMPTLVGNSVVLAAPGNYYAFDQLTGAMNQFFDETFSGGGGTTVAFDSTRNQFYVKEPTRDWLTAFSYTNNSSITQVWRYSTTNTTGGSVAIGLDGRIYAGGAHSQLVELDPASGNLLRSLDGIELAMGIAPALSANSIFLDGDGSTDIYDLDTFSHVLSLPGSRGDANSPYNSPGAVFDLGFAIHYGTGSSERGFDVYLVPEPPAVILLTAAFLFLNVRRRPTSHYHIERVSGVLLWPRRSEGARGSNGL